MNKNLFLKEFKRNFISLLSWSLIISGLIIFTMSFYGTFVKNQAQFMGMMSIVPKEMLEMRGVSDITGLFSILGFYSANNIIYMMLLGSIYAIVLGAGILHKEEYQKTAEFLFSKPLSRSEIFNTKFIVFLFNILALNIFTDLVGLFSIEVFKTGELSIMPYVYLCIYTLLLNLLFGTLGLFISVFAKRSKPLTTFGVAIVMILYFIFTISKITESAKNIGYLSPFKYARTDIVSDNYGIDIPHLLYFMLIAAFFIIASHIVYKRKDIYL